MSDLLADTLGGKADIQRDVRRSPWRRPSSTVITFVLGLDYRNEWFPRAFGLGGVQGGSTALLCGLVTNEGGIHSVMNPIRSVTMAQVLPPCRFVQ
jgi:hypothetical protein